MSAAWAKAKVARMAAASASELCFFRCFETIHGHQSLEVAGRKSWSMAIIKASSTLFRCLLFLQGLNILLTERSWALTHLQTVFSERHNPQQHRTNLPIVPKKGTPLGFGAPCSEGHPYSWPPLLAHTSCLASAGWAKQWDAQWARLAHRPTVIHLALSGLASNVLTWGE